MTWREGSNQAGFSNNICNLFFAEHNIIVLVAAKILDGNYAGNTWFTGCLQTF